MADDFSTVVEPYQILKERGGQPHEVGSQTKEDGLPLRVRQFRYVGRAYLVGSSLASVLIFWVLSLWPSD